MEWLNLGFNLEMLFPALGLLLPMKKKKHGMRNGILFFLLGSFVLNLSLRILENRLGSDTHELTYLSNQLSLFTFFSGMMWFALSWALILGMIYLMAEVKAKDCLYVFAITYAVEHIFYCVRIFVAYITDGKVGEMDGWFYGICLILSFLLAYFGFAKGAINDGQYQIHTISAVGSTFAILWVVWVLSIWASVTDIEHIHAIYASLACFFLLHNQKQQLAREKEKAEFEQKEKLWQKSMMRYQISKDAINIVNQQYHDMKHKMNALANMQNVEQRDKYLLEMENQIAEYDAVVRTGNDFLDTVLTEKKLICHSREIAMSCIADGSLMNFMDELDLYTLFGNAIDNAIEANCKIADQEKRWISVQLQEKKGILLVEIMNPFLGELEYNGDLPKTTKKDSFSHGFGVASIKSIVEKYNGQLVIKADHNKYLLRMVFQK